MKISMIAAMGKNRVIGSSGKLPWDIPEDMKFFMTKTMGHPCIMGRKTYDSLGGRLLPRRENIVVTRQKDFKAPGATVFSTLSEALAYCREKYKANPSEEIFIIGGGEIYLLGLEFCDRIYLTEIDREFEGDAKFPQFSKEEFNLVERVPREHPVPFAFCTYDRK